MKLTAAVPAALAALLSVSLAAPLEGLVIGNPLVNFPKLTGFDGRPGFAMVDPDGVYRAYLADGTVVDAARLTSEQVQTFVDARAPFMSAEEAAKERELYAGVDGQNVAEDRLLNPAEELRPKALLEGFNHDLTSARDAGPLVEKRQTLCPSFYCGASPSICSIYGCRCNGSICVIY